jgi:hypothetical protein
MARKLSSHEKAKIDQLLQADEFVVLDPDLAAPLVRKRDTALALSPELAAWFGLPVPPPSESGQ